MCVYKDLHGVQNSKNVICVGKNMVKNALIVMNFNVLNV